jgi:hypothetical protein
MFPGAGHTDDGLARGDQNSSVSVGLGEQKLKESKVPSRNLNLGVGRGNNLEKDAFRGPTLVKLTGGVEKSGTKTNGHWAARGPFDAVANLAP